MFVSYCGVGSCWLGLLRLACRASVLVALGAETLYPWPIQMAHDVVLQHSRSLLARLSNSRGGAPSTPAKAKLDHRLQSPSPWLTGPATCSSVPAVAAIGLLKLGRSTSARTLTRCPRPGSGRRRCLKRTSLLGRSRPRERLTWGAHSPSGLRTSWRVCAASPLCE